MVLSNIFELKSMAKWPDWITVQRSLPAFLWSTSDTGRSKEYWSSLQDVSHAVVANLNRDTVTLKMLTLAHPLAEGVLLTFLVSQWSTPSRDQISALFSFWQGELAALSQCRASVASRASLMGSHCSALETFTLQVCISLSEISLVAGVLKSSLFILRNTMIEGMTKV